MALISLIGLPGSGKTTVGWGLARRMGLSFVDSDQVIAERIGCSIRSYFERAGEDSFRDIEQEVIDQLTEVRHGVLSTGGGAVLRAENRRRLKACSDVIYLRASPEEIFRRLRHDQSRPLLQVSDPLERLRDLFRQRDPLYQETATYVVEAHRPSPSKVLNMVIMQLELAGKLA